MFSEKEKRRFVRHPVSYPLEVEYAPKKTNERSQTLNISKGGLLFLSKRNLRPGKIVVLKLPLQDKLFKIKAKVEHTSKDKESPDLYRIGVSFYRYADAFKVKLIEQIYLIDEYRAIRSIESSRDLSFKEASDEWIKRYSKRFDRMFWGKRRKK